MKKLFLSFFVAGIFTAPVFAFAAVSLDQQIADLQANIAQLQNQLNQLLAERSRSIQNGDAVRAAVGLNVRITPSSSASKLGRAPVGATGTVRCDQVVTGTSCPITADGYTWWYIAWDNQSLQGWSAEGSSEAVFLEKINSGSGNAGNRGSGDTTISGGSSGGFGTSGSAGAFGGGNSSTGGGSSSATAGGSAGGGSGVIGGGAASGSATVQMASCATSFTPGTIKIGDITTLNFQAGAGDTTFQYSCSDRFTKEDGTAMLSYGSLPLSGSWRIKAPGPLDCTLTSYNPNVVGSGSTCRAFLSVTFFTITTASLPNAAVNVPYQTTLSTTDVGTSPYQWSWSPLSGGVLPAGLSINQSTGAISGRPTTAGKYSVTIKAVDTAGTVAAKTFTLYVDAQAGVTSQCTTSFSPNPAKVGTVTTWNFQSGAGDTTFQYSCSAGITKDDGTVLLSYGTLPLSGPWNIKVSGPLDCTLDSYNPNVVGSGSQCRAILNTTLAGTLLQSDTASIFSAIQNQLNEIREKINALVSGNKF